MQIDFFVSSAKTNQTMDSHALFGNDVIIDVQNMKCICARDS